MTKLECAEEIIRQEGDCKGIECSNNCCILNECEECFNDKERLQLAKQYKKEYNND